MSEEWNKGLHSPRLEALLKDVRQAAKLSRELAAECRMKAELIRQGKEAPPDAG